MKAVTASVPINHLPGSRECWLGRSSRARNSTTHTAFALVELLVTVPLMTVMVSPIPIAGAIHLVVLSASRVAARREGTTQTLSMIGRARAPPLDPGTRM